ncbi:arsenate reductase (glutaredoxin) [Alishewanella sp. SMS8]|uniref:arsenate reductase (glutaredoxin) n=1 Tax=unclassified Alishewanella TaxID=2628974 RepID=UPI0027418F5B|nr:arsenate reductase (glutaredoxin) [Alishewanella sp. SMS8]MDP4946239.1 arsenate reductase (glutaredoxin) [Alishewanella sp.]MDP5034800.1 arsenate reductase (glutaredoxin) [Alishewanella sp.]MDP5185976.1 arsenate reductase (glutaredoxin) [Alishewanella sp.]MDP5457834.1 arsenate reductase (glutaredoxin) [Alishewanella sp. SMS8]
MIIYHNPRCSKSRDALALLADSGQSYQVVEYLKTPLDYPAIVDLLSKLKLPARQILRSKEPEYQSLNLADPSLSEQQIIEAVVAHPRLMERPIVVKGEQAAIGRPLANIEALLA